MIKIVKKANQPIKQQNITPADKASGRIFTCQCGCMVTKAGNGKMLTEVRYD